MRQVLFSILILLGFDAWAQGRLDTSESYALIRRVLPAGRAAAFVVEEMDRVGGKDCFSVESRGGKIVLRGNNGVAVASALYYYLTTYCHCQITWNGVNLHLPSTLPMVSKRVIRPTPYEYRYYLNYCTFNYSMSWWDWKRWEKEIDWMALHGINMPLAITGEEYTWYTVYKEMGFSDEELAGFFSGPCYFAWFWMGNLDGWGGPLPVEWMKEHMQLQQQILKRERALGMKTVLPAFTGHVPASFVKHFPGAKLKQTNWKNGFADTYILDPQDSLFAVVGRRFLETQQRIFGTDHLYSADTFNENEPPSDDPAFLAGLSKRLYDAMHAADDSATWVMQGWLFYSDRKFWKAPQIQAMLDAVPNEHMLLLDLAAEIEPIWKRTMARAPAAAAEKRVGMADSAADSAAKAATGGLSEGQTLAERGGRATFHQGADSAAFYGKPWIWCMLNNFGGNINLFGRMDGVASGPATALHDPGAGLLKGIGLTMEGIEQNPVIYELMTQHVWQDTVIDPAAWLRTYVRNRYGGVDPRALRAWDVLRATVYNGREIRDGAESIITGRPTFDSTTVWTRTKLNYDPAALLPAWDLMIQCAPLYGSRDGYRYDLVDLTRQVMANYATPLQRKWIAAYRAGRFSDFAECSDAFIELINDMDRLLMTRSEFMVGPWIASAQKWGRTPAQKALYEQNARDLLTLWGDANSPLHEYANRQWSGLLSDFYKERWEQYFSMLRRSLRDSVAPDLEGFERKIRQWEWKWVNTKGGWPVIATSLDACVEAKRMYSKYRHKIEMAYHE